MLSKLKELKKFLTLKNILSALGVILVVAVSVSICVYFAKTEEPTSAPEPEIIPAIKEAAEEEFIAPLVFSSPTDAKVTTTEPHYVISGTCDPKKELTVNGEKVDVSAEGDFSFKVDLKKGNNGFEFKYHKETITKTINYKYVVLKGCEPKGSKTYSSGSTISVKVTARINSSVSASFNGETVKCTTAASQDDEEKLPEGFANFFATFKLPSGNKSDINLGKITFKATEGGVTDTASSGNITVKKSSVIKDSDPAVTPSGGDYTDVGSGLVATVVADYAETFNGETSDDYSNPAYNYLPKGTQDYCAEGIVTNGSRDYYKLRCGRRIYKTSSPGYDYAQTVATTAIGKLPDHNELELISFETGDKYTFITLLPDWKAPFYFELKNQSYYKTNQGYSTDSITFSYLDITFCYATVFEGEITIPEDHPVFKSAEIIKNANDYTLRLHLKKTGGFYGWDCYYDNNGQLVFRILNPAKMENEDSLKGITVYLDVGHGGKDGGASGIYNPYWNEAKCNLYLAEKVRAKLEEKGAQVIMNRTSSVLINPPDRIKGLRDSVADLCIAIHHDSSGSSSANGFMSAYFTPYSKTAAEFVSTRSYNTGLYSKNWPVKSHYYYVSRTTSCPVVLTENGFISNKSDYATMVGEAAADKKAEAIAQAVLDYFRSIQ